MTVQDLIEICKAEGTNPEEMNVVLGFVGGPTFTLSVVDGSEAGDSTTMFLTPIEFVGRGF